MVRIKSEYLNLESLKPFGFFDTGMRDFALDPAVENEGHPLAKMFTVLNTFIQKETGKFWCGFQTDDVVRVLQKLFDAGMVEEVL